MKTIIHAITIVFDRLPAHEKRITPSTLLTLTRFILIPYIMNAITSHTWSLAIMLLTLAGATDLLDGALARLRDEQTILGACLDPIADKLLIIGCFMSFSNNAGSSLGIPLWCTGIIICKELIQVLGALFIYTISGSIYAQPTLLGKMTATLQIVFMIWLSTCNYYHWMPLKTYGLMSALMITCILLSFCQYAHMGKQLLLGTLKNNIR